MAIFQQQRMNIDNDPLCCCEYFDIKQERNHILACCCNCQDLDESFDSLIMGKGISSHGTQRLTLTCQDRLRIPWLGGARKVTPDAILPILIMPLILFLSAIHFWWTIVMFSLMSITLSYLNCFCLFLKNSKFFLSWMLTSVIFLFFVFETIVIPILDIYIHENVAVVALICIYIGCAYIVRMRTAHLQYPTDEVETADCGKIVSNRTLYCTICHISICKKDHHCVWYKIQLFTLEINQFRKK